MKRYLYWVTAAPLLVCGAAGIAEAGNAAQPVGAPVLEAPTLRSLGVYWIVRGDDNRNAVVRLQRRKPGEQTWRDAPPLFRVERGAHHPKEQPSLLDVPADAWLFAGSALMLEPDTRHELRLTLSDPDSGEAQEQLTASTIGEPVAPKGGPVYHVAPGSAEGGVAGKGTADDPYRGIAAAERNAKPGDTFLLRPGVYEGPITLRKSGEPGKPIIWRGAPAPGSENEKTILDAQGSAAERPGRGIQAVGLHDVWFEDLTIRNASHAIVAHESARIVLRRCHIYSVDFGLTATKNSNDELTGFFISDNVIEGPSTWPRSEGIEDARGIQLSGVGHVVCYNRIRAFGDAIDTFPSPRCEAVDFHNNDVSELTDDGIEMDYSQRNTRCFENRLTNVYQGISVQPVYGGPVYVFRNAMYNVCVETFKIHNGPSGVLLVHNTSVRAESPLVVWTNKPFSNFVSRNNLFVGTSGNYAFECQAPVESSDFDYDGFAGGPFKQFLKWNGQRYPSFGAMKQNAPIYRHAVLLDAATVFTSGVQPPKDSKTQFDVSPDLRLAPGSAAIDAGEHRPGFNDDYSGSAPDLGAFETGADLPHYGPRPRSQTH